MDRLLRCTMLLVLTGCLAMPAAGGDLQVISAEPTPRTVTAPVETPIVIHFDRAVDPATVTSESFHAFGRWSGAAAGTISFSDDFESMTLAPDRPFSAGEAVMVILSHDIAGQDGSPLRSAGYSFQFWTRTKRSNLTFDHVQTLDTRTTPGDPSRAYGGFASDLDNDRWLDVTIVNEITADLRVFLNHADGSGRFDGFLQPTFPVGNRASPSEPADFNRDGNVDVCVANINDDTVSILLGNGDGTFAPQQSIAVGSAPRGIAVLDADGDGDADVVNTNSGGGGNLSIMFNDGSGVFGPPTLFEGGGSGEWALAVADMNEDGILDLIVGARSDSEIIILAGNGDGTFSFASATPAGGAVWMLVCGDVNGDGHEDVATANSFNNNGAILLGDGAGGFLSSTTTPTDPFPLATDLADLDGDGDLDWTTSSFDGDWMVFRNDGSGTFTFDQEFTAPQAASCTLPFDCDNDGDLDLGLIDELADVVLIMHNAGPACPADLDASGAVGVVDLLILLEAWQYPGGSADLNADGVVNVIDLLILLGWWGPCP